MAARVLFVDDEENILNGIKRQLRKQYAVETALGDPRHWNSSKEVRSLLSSYPICGCRRWMVYSF